MKSLRGLASPVECVDGLGNLPQVGGDFFFDMVMVLGE
jgi:hypothetical protein